MSVWTIYLSLKKFSYDCEREKNYDWQSAQYRFYSDVDICRAFPTVASAELVLCSVGDVVDVCFGAPCVDGIGETAAVDNYPVWRGNNIVLWNIHVSKIRLFMRK